MSSSRSAVSAILRTAVWGLCLALSQIAHATLPIESWTLPNGARVLFVENRALPMLDVSVDFPAGSSRDEPATSGLAGMTVALMRLGTQSLDEAGVAAELADVGAQMSSRFDSDRGGYGLRTLSSAKERERALSVLASVLQSPTFPADILEREKSRLAAALKEADSKPETIAQRAFSTAVYQSHPYGLRGSGELSTLGRLTASDLQAFHQRWFRSDWAVVALMGDISREEADAVARRLTERLPRAEEPLPSLPAVEDLAAPVQRVIDHPASQSHILVGQPGITRTDPDYFPLFVGNYILGGGGFASRMVEEVRQKRGLAYSSYSYFSPLEQRGVFQIGLQTKKEQAAQALEVVRDTVARFVAEGPTPAELEAAKMNLVGGFPLRIDSNKKIHDYLGLIGFYRLPLDYLDRFVENIESVSVEQVRDAFRRRVNPDRMVTVVVAGAVPQK